MDDLYNDLQKIYPEWRFQILKVEQYYEILAEHLKTHRMVGPVQFSKKMDIKVIINELSKYIKKGIH